MACDKNKTKQQQQQQQNLIDFKPNINFNLELITSELEWKVNNLTFDEDSILEQFTDKKLFWVHVLYQES